MGDGIEPEEIDYRNLSVIRAGYQLRPEIIESAYYLYHYTHDPRYLEMGKTFFDDIVKYCRVENGYTVLQSVVTHEQGDRMHSFFLAETLKNLYLLFAPDDTLNFDQVTFNTEAHPLRKVRRVGSAGSGVLGFGGSRVLRWKCPRRGPASLGRVYLTMKLTTGHLRY